MSVVNVIDMTFVFDRGVAAVRGVPVTVVGMDFGIAHKFGIELNVVWSILLKTQHYWINCIAQIRCESATWRSKR
jgi:hypothetical protein